MRDEERGTAATGDWRKEDGGESPRELVDADSSPREDEPGSDGRPEGERGPADWPRKKGEGGVCGRPYACEGSWRSEADGSSPGSSDMELLLGMRCVGRLGEIGEASELCEKLDMLEDGRGYVCGWSRSLREDGRGRRLGFATSSREAERGMRLLAVGEVALRD